MPKTVLDVFKRKVDPDKVYDVVVCGSGPAGIGAALAAAMNGAKTVILEARAQLGGTASAAMWMTMNYLYKDNNETDRGGVNKIIIDELGKWGVAASLPGYRGDHEGEGGNLFVHPEYFKKILFDLLERYEIDYQLYSPVVDVVKEGKILTGVVIGAKEGNVTIKGKIIIDATGDGDVAWLSGCQMAEGQEETGWRAPVTVAWAVGNVNTERFYKWLFEEDGKKTYNRKRLSEEMKAKAEAKGYRMPSWISFHKTTIPGMVSINDGTSMDLYVDLSNSYSMTYMEKAALDQALDFIKFARTEKLIPGMEDIYLVRTGGYAMARDTRRLVGEYVYTNDDVMKGSVFEDTVASKYGGSDPVGDTRPMHVVIKQGAAYPYRSYLPKEVDGLLVAGRCASATFMGSFGGKSIGNMLCMGQAAGVASALCTKMGIQPRALDAKLIQKKLDEMGVSL